MIRRQINGHVAPGSSGLPAVRAASPAAPNFPFADEPAPSANGPTESPFSCIIGSNRRSQSCIQENGPRSLIQENTLFSGIQGAAGAAPYNPATRPVRLGPVLEFGRELPVSSEFEIGAGEVAGSDFEIGRGGETEGAPPPSARPARQAGVPHDATLAIFQFYDNSHRRKKGVSRYMVQLEVFEAPVDEIDTTKPDHKLYASMMDADAFGSKLATEVRAGRMDPDTAAVCEGFVAMIDEDPCACPPLFGWVMAKGSGTKIVHEQVVAFQRIRTEDGEKPVFSLLFADRTDVIATHRFMLPSRGHPNSAVVVAYHDPHDHNAIRRRKPLRR